MGFLDFFKNKPSGAPASPEEEKRRADADFAILRDDGVRAMKMGEMKYAEKCFSKALELQDDLRVRKFLAEARLNLQEFEAALPVLRSVAEAEPENMEACLLLAQAQGKTGDFAAMKETCSGLLAAHPDEARANYLAGEAAHGLGDDFSAIALLTKAVEAQPDYTAPRLLRAQVLASMGQYKEVLDDARELLARDGENEDFLLLQGDALAATGQEEAAEAAYTGLYALNPFCREAVLRLAALYARTSRLDKALALCDEAVGLQPDFAEAYKLRGGIKLQLHDKEGAADDLKRSLELKPEEAAAIDGEFTNVENRMGERYRSMNPYGF